MIKLIQSHHHPASLQRNYSLPVVSILVVLRRFGDDDGDVFPSPEPEMDSRSALPRKNRRWRRLRLVKRDENFSLIFFSEDVIL